MTVDRRECVAPQWASPLQANPPQINLLLSNLLQIKKASLCLCLLLPGRLDRHQLLLVLDLLLRRDRFVDLAVQLPLRSPATIKEKDPA